jgi:hypothetical protein
MKEFDLSHAVTSLSHYASATGTLWGIFAAATFAASGFGISMEERFTTPIALFLTIGFLAFAIGHWYFIQHHVGVQRRIATEILSYLKTSGSSATDFPDSIRAICESEVKESTLFRVLGIETSTLTHVAIDICVLLVIWSIVK